MSRVSKKYEVISLVVLRYKHIGDILEWHRLPEILTTWLQNIKKKKSTELMSLFMEELIFSFCEDL